LPFSLFHSLQLLVQGARSDAAASFFGDSVRALGIEED
jgi:hypothetical protein